MKIELTDEWRVNAQNIIEQRSIPIPECGCWIWEYSTQLSGYGQVRLGGELWYAHRLSFLAFGGEELFEGEYVCHSCDTRPCVNPDHLWLGDAIANNEDMRKKGRDAYATGENHPQSKLAQSQVVEIFTDPRSHRKIANDYGISHRTVGDIKSGQSWSHLGLITQFARSAGK